MDVFPKKIGEWIRAEYRKYPEPYGYSVTYTFNLESGVRTACTIYFYKGDTEGELESGCASAEVKEQFETAIQGVQENQTEAFQSIRQTDASQVLIGEGPYVLAALRANFVGTTKDGKDRLTQVYLTSTRFGFIKIRLSSERGWNDIKGQVMRLFGQILKTATQSKDEIHAVTFNDDERVLAATLIDEDKVNPALLADILGRAGLKVITVGDAEISVTVGGARVTIEIKPNLKVLKFLMAFGLRPRVTEENKQEFSNRASNTIMMCRFSAPKHDSDVLVSDYHLCYAGGLCDVQLIATFDLFLKTTIAAIESCGGKDLM